MRDDILFNSGKKSIYTEAEIEQAQKMKKKNGGTLMDNLAKLTGKSMPSMTSTADLSSMYKKANAELNSMMEADKKRKEAEERNEAVKNQLLENQDKLNKALDSYTNTLKEEFGIESGIDNSWMRDFGVQPTSGNSAGSTVNDTYASAENAVNSAAQAVRSTEEELQSSREQSLEKFNGLADEINKKVFGQEEFVKKLVIAFKRPLVMPPENPKALNTIFINGKSDTGKHFALEELAKELNKRGILRNPDIRVLNLGIYTDASMEKLFLQDIFSALSCNSRIVLFENFESCHPSFLSLISSLVIEGRFQLSERYIMQKGQLVNVQNALASEAGSACTANGKYLSCMSDTTIHK